MRPRLVKGGRRGNFFAESCNAGQRAGDSPGEPGGCPDPRADSHQASSFPGHRSGSLTSMSSPATSAPTNPPFGRVATAMITPFRPDGSLDLEVAQKVATHLVDHGN